LNKVIIIKRMMETEVLGVKPSSIAGENLQMKNYHEK
jgi:hypothetical protein